MNRVSSLFLSALVVPMLSLNAAVGRASVAESKPFCSHFFSVLSSVGAGISSGLWQPALWTPQQWEMIRRYPEYDPIRMTSYKAWAQDGSGANRSGNGAFEWIVLSSPSGRLAIVDAATGVAVPTRITQEQGAFWRDLPARLTVAFPGGSRDLALNWSEPTGAELERSLFINGAPGLELRAVVSGPAMNGHRLPNRFSVGRLSSTEVERLGRRFFPGSTGPGTIAYRGFDRISGLIRLVAFEPISHGRVWVAGPDGSPILPSELQSEFAISLEPGLSLVQQKRAGSAELEQFLRSAGEIRLRVRLVRSADQR